MASANKVIIDVVTRAKTGGLDDVAEAAEDAADALDHAADEADDVGDELKRADRAARKTAAGLKKAGKSAARSGRQFMMASRSMKALAGPAAAAAAVLATVGAGLGIAGVSAVKTAGNLEKFETQLGILLGSADKGKATVRELFEISSKTPFDVTSIVEAEATLERFGANAPVWRDGVMDLAGAMGMDLVEASNAVGKALAGGAGAADVLREKGVIAMVEMDAGMKASEMSTNQFREALLKTLNTNDKLAGGTQKLALTFGGMMSTMRDQWTMFSKEIADADLFATVKASLFVMLELIKENKVGIMKMAASIGKWLAGALITTIDVAFKFAAIIQRIREGFWTVVQVVKVLAIGLAEMVQGIMLSLTRIPLIGDSIKGAIGGALTFIEKDIGRMNRDLHATSGKIDSLRASQKNLLATGDATVRKIGGLAAKYQEAADAAKDIKLPKGQTGTMRSAGLAEKGKAGAGGQTATEKAESDLAKKREAFLKKHLDAAEKINGATTKMIRTAAGQTKESDKLRAKQEGLRKQMGKMRAEAEALGVDLGGPQMTAAFGAVKNQIKAVETLRLQALSNEKRAAAETAAAAKKERVAAAAGIAGEALQGATGGGIEGMLGMAGPWGAAAAGAIGIGRGASQARDSAVQDLAQEQADKRVENLEKKREEMMARGLDEAQLSAMGLGEEDLAKAAEVTEEDVAKAEGLAPAAESFIKEQVTAMVKGLIEGAKAIILALPDIIVELIPPLITEFIPELIVAIFKMIPALFKMFFTELPKRIFDGISKWWKAIKEWFRDLFTIGKGKGKYTGGFIPETGRYLLHQGERVVPSSGATTGTAQGLSAFMGAGQNITVHTNVVDQDAIPALGRLINQELGEFGRMSFPVFNS